MKKIIFSGVFLLTITMLISISCATPQQTAVPQGDLAPAAQVETPAPAPAASVAAPQADPAARARANEARQQAIDFQSPDYFPSEWEAIEAQFRAANSTADYNAAADAYNDLFRKTVPLFAQAKEDEILAARTELIATGLAPSFPGLLREADNLTLSALDQYEADDFVNARITAEQALQKYQDYLLAADGYLTREELIATGLAPYYPDLLWEADTIALDAIDQYEDGDRDSARTTAEEAVEKYEDYLFAAQVYLSRQALIDRGFTRFDSGNFARADSIAYSGIEAYLDGDKEAARVAAEEALLRYNIVLSNGWVSFSTERQGIASSERDRAMAERANIASRDNFRDGEAFLAQAERLLAAGNYNEAATIFIDAEAMFAIARQDTRERRHRAEEAIRTAEERIGHSDETAREAERIIEGGSR